MITQVVQKEKYDIVEFLKNKEYAEWSSISETNHSNYTAKQPTRLKTLPQADWHNIERVTADLKAALPNLKPAEVRRLRIPFHEAILLELEEDCYDEAAQYLRELLQLDERINKNTTGVPIYNKPFLKDQAEYIDRLKHGLVEFEKANRRGNLTARATALLDTALFFQEKPWEWWWVAERLYQTALSAAESIEDDRQPITLIRYLYGRFLLLQLQKPEEAIDYLNEARLGAQRKAWTASKKVDGKQGSIFKESNILLYKALLLVTQKLRPSDPELALKACTTALERASDADRNEYVDEVLYELGKCYVSVNDTRRALQTFSKLLATAKRIPDIEGVCNAHMELAFTYRQLDDNLHTEKHLRLFREQAAKFDLTEKLADAHYYTGEHYLSKGKTDLSTVHLETALSLYNRLGLSDNADRARSIAGISKGQERIKQYLDLIIRCGDHDRSATLKICQWKARREVFWTDKQYGDKKKSNLFHTIIQHLYDTIKSFHLF